MTITIIFIFGNLMAIRSLLYENITNIIPNIFNTFLIFKKTICLLLIRILRLIRRVFRNSNLRSRIYIYSIAVLKRMLKIQSKVIIPICINLEYLIKK